MVCLVLITEAILTLLLFMGGYAIIYLTGYYVVTELCPYVVTEYIKPRWRRYKYWKRMIKFDKEYKLYLYSLEERKREQARRAEFPLFYWNKPLPPKLKEPNLPWSIDDYE